MTRRLSPWWLLLIVIPLGVGLTRLRFDVEVLNLLPSNLPVVEGLKLYQRHFANVNELVLTVQSGDPETTMEAARQFALALVTQTNLVARAIWQSPWQEHPEQMAEWVALTWLNQPPELFMQLADRLAPATLPRELEAARGTLATSLSPETIARLSYDPLGFTRLPDSVAAEIATYRQGDQMFASADGTFRLVFVRPAITLHSYRDCDAWVGRIRETIADVCHENGMTNRIRIGFTGAPAFVSEIAGGMERDLSGSASGTLLVVTALFWWAHRRLWPLAWLTVLLLLVLAAALALGGLLYGTINVISLGFAAILIGLTDDYPAVLYQEALDHPGMSAADIRTRCARAIGWSAVTTAGAFLLLNFAALPGLAQLGTLVALGILLAAVVMLYAFLPVAMRRMERKRILHPMTPPAVMPFSSWYSAKLAWATTLALLISALVVVWRHPPRLDHSADALIPTYGPAHAAMKEVETHFAGSAEPLWVVVSGSDEAEVARRIELLESELESDEIQPWLQQVTFPTALWPQPARQQANRLTASRLCAQQENIRAAVLEAGFNEEALRLADSVLAAWARASAIDDVLWPTNAATQWLLEKISARSESGWLALGVAHPATNSAAAYAAVADKLGTAFATNGGHLTGWAALGEAMLLHAQQRLPWLMIAMLSLVAICLWLAFRNILEVLLSFATMATGLLLLLMLMSLLGWSWNLINLTAVPLLLGASVDYTIHTQMALRRNRGDIPVFHRTTGRALLLASATTIAGFTSLAWAGNAGLASLGRLCALGLACVLVASVGLLPAWWRAINAPQPPSPVQPSTLYRREIWWVGLWLGRTLPASLCRTLARIAGLIYWRLNPRRRRVVFNNLLPACDGNSAAATRATRRLFQEFAVKVADLWRFESGAPMPGELRSWSGWETLEAAYARRKGVLLVTPHLGNWEFGGQFLADRGFTLTVLTQAEPGTGFTTLRQQARMRWGIETIVVGDDSFAFVEIIKRLQAGALVALLVDRPLPPTATTVQLFGRPFHASLSAAELARATGCALVPVSVVHEKEGFAAHFLPEIHYERAAIGNREARGQLTQEIMRAFEPMIRQHVTQWYHFVPIWPAASDPGSLGSPRS